MSNGISTSSRIVIAGGGIGGLATAIALEQRGFRPRVCERAPQLKEIGAGLLLSPNGVRALEFLGVRQAAAARSRLIREWRILNRSGRCLQRMQPRHRDFPAYSLHRADLQILLVKTLSAGCLRLGAEVKDFAPQDDTVEISLASGEVLQADAFVGADGLKSVVREARFGRQLPQYSGYTGWRGVCPWIPPAYQAEYLSESWAEGKRFGISPLGNGCCYWYATANRPASNLSSSSDIHTELLEVFGHWHRPVAELIQATPTDQIIAGGIYDRPAQHPWSLGAVTLLGDAAHPMTPNLGQGAGFALEDACVLARCIDEAVAFPDAFRRYEHRRRARTDSVQRRSRWLGKLIQLRAPTTTRLRDLVLLATPDSVANLSMRGLFAFKP